MRKRPVNLNLLTIRFNITAIASILHRITGIILFLSLPLILYALKILLKSPADFGKAVVCITSFPMHLLAWAMVAAFIYHAVAGLRHLIMDLGFGESREIGVLSAYVTIGFALLLTIGLYFC